MSRLLSTGPPRGTLAYTSAVAICWLVLAVVQITCAWRLHATASTLEDRAALLGPELAGIVVHEQAGPGPQAGLHPASALGAPMDASVVVARIEDAARRASVVVQRIEINPSSPTRQDLGRLQVNLTASGDYASLKQWQAETMSRLPTATLSQLRMERREEAATAAGQLEFAGVLTLWSSPQLPEGTR